MIDGIDEALRQLLIRELPVEDNEIDITFDQPNREWTSRLNRPTLNLFLYSLYENKKLRQAAQPIWDMKPGGNDTVIRQRRPLRVDLTYLITVWTAEPEDEHRLLGRSLMVFNRYAHLPEELLPEDLKGQTKPIPLKVAQEEDLHDPDPGDLWGSVDNEWRPGFTCVLTLGFDPYQPLTLPLVRSRELRIGLSSDPSLEQLTSLDRSFWTIGGNLHTDRPLEEIQLRLVEQGLEVPLQPEGRFTIGNLKAGHYTLEIQVKGRQPRRHKVTVPAADYDFEV